MLGGQELEIILNVEYTGEFQLAIDANLVILLILYRQISVYQKKNKIFVRCLIKWHLLMWRYLE